MCLFSLPDNSTPYDTILCTRYVNSIHLLAKSFLHILSSNPYTFLPTIIPFLFNSFMCSMYPPFLSNTNPKYLKFFTSTISSLSHIHFHFVFFFPLLNPITLVFPELNSIFLSWTNLL